MFDEKKVAKVKKWLHDRGIIDVEVIVSDFAGISRGKIMPTGKFLGGLRSRGHRIPESLFGIQIDCDFSHNNHLTDLEEDLFLVPDISSLRVVPWRDVPTASVICDPVKEDGTPSTIYPREVLRRVVKLYQDRGWQPVVAPEFEFYLLHMEGDENPPIPPRGKSGKIAWDSGELSIDGLEEFNNVFSDIHRYSDMMDIQVDTLTHEAGPAQFEFNITHGDPVVVADQSFIFKRIVKQTAIRHGMFASFMAKPYPDQFGSAMHIHQSVVNKKTNKNIFADSKGKDSELFMNHVAGLQKYIPAVMPFLAPYANSYLRICDRVDAPVNTHWGHENRSVGFRVPVSRPSERRVENRIAGADVNPYLAFAASLIAGYLGMAEELEPSEPLTRSAYDLNTRKLPQHLFSSLENLRKCKPVKDHLGEEFVMTYLDVKLEEYKANMNTLSPWEIRYILLNV